MHVPWEVRQVRIAESKKEEVRAKNEKPRFALWLARFFLGDTYNEDHLPASVINFLYIGTIIGTLLVVGTVAYIAWRYPPLTAVVILLAGLIWPVARLMFLNDNNQMLVHQGVANPDAQRLFSWIALACIAIVATCSAFSYYGSWNLYPYAALAGAVYGGMTFIIFEFSILGWMGRVKNWLKDVGYEVLFYIGVAALIIIVVLSKEKSLE